MAGYGGRKPEGGNGKEERGKARKKKRHTVDLIFFPGPVTGIDLLFPLGNHFQPMLKLAQQSSEVMLGMGRRSHGRKTTKERTKGDHAQQDTSPMSDINYQAKG